MKLCVSVCMNTLKAFKKPSTTQIELGRALLESVTGDNFVGYSDAQISDLFRGKKNVGDFELVAARSYVENGYLKRFESLVIPLLNANEITSVVAAMRRLVANDRAIKSQTIVDPISGLSKEEIEARSSFVATEFLSGLFLYALTNVENKGTGLDACEVNETFIMAAQADSEEIILVDSWDDMASVYVNFWKSGPNSISLISGDIFVWPFRAVDSGDKRIVVIPVDTTFCVRLSSGIEGGQSFPCIRENASRQILEEMGGLR